ncbi:MAG TPA: radical SAM protein [candidate division Zixibacteria bacterium]|nr:radical SAM protein [candidate division Zixibacteria bacterium]HER00691.1 radical SAM protein [candidate division Zixibacteria bacterium]
MLKGIHFLLTYKCTYECDHCFLYCGPHEKGTFTLKNVEAVLEQAGDLGTVKTIYLEGGEPFLFYPMMLESARRADEMGFKIGFVTNAYWATSEEDAELWLKPLLELNISDLSISDDELHGSPDAAGNALRAAKKLGFASGSICIEKPVTLANQSESGQKGEPVVGGDVLFKGRAADKLTENLPRISYKNFKECPHEELVSPGRVHVDPYGNVMLCQGLCIGNLFQKPLSDIMKDYDHSNHPICGPLLSGGPARLAEKYGVEIESGYVDACHMCFLVRRALLKRFPQFLAPPQVYGTTENE